MRTSRLKNSTHWQGVGRRAHKSGFALATALTGNAITDELITKGWNEAAARAARGDDLVIVPKISLPRLFYWDHHERDLPTPAMLAGNRAHIIVALDDPHIDELLSDAEHYADGVDQLPPGLQSSARATVRAIRKARGQLNQ